MRKIMAVVLAVASLGIFAVTGEANVARNRHLAMSEFSPSAPQVRIQIGQRRRYGRRYDRYDDRYDRRVIRTVRRTRLVRYGWRTYRETYLVRYFPSGRTQIVLIDRDRIS